MSYFQRKITNDVIRDCQMSAIQIITVSEIGQICSVRKNILFHILTTNVSAVAPQLHKLEKKCEKNIHEIDFIRTTPAMNHKAFTMNARILTAITKMSILISSPVCIGY